MAGEEEEEEEEEQEAEKKDEGRNGFTKEVNQRFSYFWRDKVVIAPTKATATGMIGAGFITISTKDDMEKEEFTTATKAGWLFIGVPL